jgi:hypothetical protein
MTLQSPTLGTAQDPDLRALLVARISKFPSQIRIEQIWSLTKYAVAMNLFMLAYYCLAVLVTHLLRWLLNVLGLAIPGFEYFAKIARLAFVFWVYFWPSTRFIDRFLQKYFGMRSRFLRGRDQSPIVNAINSGATIGLHLRAFQDEEPPLYPGSRDKVPQALQSIDNVFFVTVSNPRHDRFATELFILEIPFSEWKQVVSELMQIASVIVVDTNAGIVQWIRDLNFSDVRDLDRMAWEFQSRAGLIDELREIVAKGFVNKTVAVVPPGWEEMKRSGEIEHQIRFEEAAAAHCRQSAFGSIKGFGDFFRTELKRILFQGLRGIEWVIIRQF